MYLLSYVIPHYKLFLPAPEIITKTLIPVEYLVDLDERELQYVIQGFWDPCTCVVLVNSYRVDKDELKIIWKVVNERSGGGIVVMARNKTIRKMISFAADQPDGLKIVRKVVNEKFGGGRVVMARNKTIQKMISNAVAPPDVNYICSGDRTNEIHWAVYLLGYVIPHHKLFLPAPESITKTLIPVEYLVELEQSIASTIPSTQL
ncbi:uncharacterized protein LOC121051961 [Rosa chinensis]|uniref:uncharacterized protein LOC121051961 n=1 Tax=Rosa chinensis TaxID=74649 RepID=UPI001AD92300|nr:uncharacterized protein LOC121051961 [Rosa chinensis]